MRKLLDIAVAALGGIAGTFILTRSMKWTSKLPASFRPPTPSRHPGEFVVEKLEKLSGRSLSPEARARTAARMQWLYGLTGPLVLGALARPLGVDSAKKAIAAGAILGTAVWAVGYLFWLPRAGLVAPVYRQPLARTMTSLLGHLAYGAVAATPLAVAKEVT